MDDFRHFEEFPADPGQMDKNGSAGMAPPVEQIHIQNQDSVFQEGGIWRFPEVDAWPDSVFSTAQEIGEDPVTEVQQSWADKANRDMAYGRLVEPPRWYNDFRLISNSPAGTSGQNGWLVKPSLGVLHSVLPSQAGTNWIVSFFDGTNTGGPPMFRYLTAMGLVPITIDIKFLQGLFITATGTAGELVVTFL